MEGWSCVKILCSHMEGVVPWTPSFLSHNHRISNFSSRKRQRKSGNLHRKTLRIKYKPPPLQDSLWICFISTFMEVGHPCVWLLHHNFPWEMTLGAILLSISSLVYHLTAFCPLGSSRTSSKHFILNTNNMVFCVNLKFHLYSISLPKLCTVPLYHTAF